MRWLLWLLISAAILSGIAFAAVRPVKEFLKNRNRPVYQTVELDRGSVRLTVPATGRLEPRLRVQIGAFVSGPIIELLADFNDVVDKDQILARIDPAIYLASVRRDEASLATAKADVDRVKALLQQAVNDERRGEEIRQENEDFIAQAELDRLRFNRMSLEAQLDLAAASVERAHANLENSRANLQYTEIKAPMPGRVIDRKIDPGQTLAAQFQAPELFVVGVDMDKEMHIYASVDEADIGLIRIAQANERAVYFRVDAYPDELFTGNIKEIRLSSTETQNVITYPVVVTASNSDLKLLPGMTAYLSFEVQEAKDVIRVPWAALRFFPPREDLVRENDRQLVAGNTQKREDDGDSINMTEDPPVSELVEARVNQRRHVWIERDGELAAVEVSIGISDYQYAVLLEGDLKPGQNVVTGVKVSRR